MNIDPQNIHYQLGLIVKTQEDVVKKLDGLSNDVQDLKLARAQAQGGWKIISVIGGLSGAIVSYFVHLIKA